MDTLGIIEFQGFKDDDNNFIVKELAMVSSSEQISMLFQAPYSTDCLRRETVQRNRWCTNNLHGIEWESGDVRYDLMQPSILSFVKQYSRLVTKGLEKSNFLTELTLRKFTNLDDVIFCKKTELPHVEHMCFHKSDYACAMRNAKSLFKWLERAQNASVVKDVFNIEQVVFNHEL